MSPHQGTARLVRLDALVISRAGQRRADLTAPSVPSQRLGAKREQTRGGAHRWLTFKSRAKKKKKKLEREYIHNSFARLDGGRLVCELLRTLTPPSCRLADQTSRCL